MLYAKKSWPKRKHHHLSIIMAYSVVPKTMYIYIYIYVYLCIFAHFHINLEQKFCGNFTPGCNSRVDVAVASCSCSFAHICSWMSYLICLRCGFTRRQPWPAGKYCYKLATTLYTNADYANARQEKKEHNARYQLLSGLLS